MVLCDMQTVLQLADGTSTLPVSVRLKGFVQTQRMDIRTCKHWLSPPHFAWHLLNVGSGLHDKDSTDYETAMLQSAGTSWHQLLRCGARVSNNTGRMAAGDARRAHQEVRNLNICFHFAAIFVQPEIFCNHEIALDSAGSVCCRFFDLVRRFGFVWRTDCRGGG